MGNDLSLKLSQVAACHGVWCTGLFPVAILGDQVSSPCVTCDTWSCETFPLAFAGGLDLHICWTPNLRQLLIEEAEHGDPALSTTGA